MNVISKFLWRWQANRLVHSEDLALQYQAIYVLGEIGTVSDYPTLMELLSNDEQYVRTAAIHAITEIINRIEVESDRTQIIDDVINKYRQADSLVYKISCIEILQVLPLEKREELFGTLVAEVGHDLQYIIIFALKDTENIDILNRVLEASNTIDLVLKRRALETWYFGLAKQEFEKVRSYCTENLHTLIRATFELQLSGEFLKKVLSYADKNELPEPLAYPDFIIRYLTELLGKWEYDPDAYRTLHSIVVPSYFTFDQNEQAPFVAL